MQRNADEGKSQLNGLHSGKNLPFLPGMVCFGAGQIVNSGTLDREEVRVNRQY